VSWLHGLAARVRLVFASRATEERHDAELEFHITMETERLVRDFGIDATEARRRALVAFGGKEQHREALRDGRGTAWLGALSLDAKLGLRMLTKYPGLTVVGVLGISVAVAVGTLAFIAAVALNSSKLPLDQGDRIVAIGNRDIGRDIDVKATHLHSLGVWRDALQTITDLSAYRLAQRNVIPPDRSPVSMAVAEMTASAFRLARVAPIRGRYFTAEDEREGAPDVAVIGADVWQRLFDGRADVVGSIVQLGASRYTVIGVMPPGFAFPINNEIWTPLRLNATGYQPGESPPINIVGRLAEDASLDDARRELVTVAPRIAELLPSRGDSIRPVVMPYARAFLNFAIGGVGPGSLAQRGQIIVFLLLMVITTNVAVLVYARTASRAGEIAVRTALGASRGRIVTQLFVEALVLSGVASIVGLAIAFVAGRRVSAMMHLAFGQVLPYWIRLEVTPAVALYVGGAAVLAAMVIGAIPALKATRHRVANSLKDLSGNASMRLGGTWTTLLVAQVAMSVAVLPIAQGGTRAFLALAVLDMASPLTSKTVIATPLLDDDADAASRNADVRRMRRERYATRVGELEQRLETDAGADVVLMSSAPDDPSDMRIELDRDPQSADTLWSYGPSVKLARVEADYFAAFDIRLLAGRMFDTADAAAGGTAVIVNRAFVKRFFDGGNALGRRVRPFPKTGTVNGVSQESSEPWWEIVGVVEDFLTIPGRTLQSGMYLPFRITETFPVTLAVRAPALEPSITAERVRRIALAVDPTLRLGPIRSVEDRIEAGIKAERLGILGIVIVTVSVVLLSTAGMYALMSFTVNRRRREIGIRSALGAGSGRVIAGILSRAMWQLGAGVAIGVVAAPIVANVAGNTSTPKELIVNGLALISVMIVVGILATIGPARRALRVHPTEALRAE
jgi:putative ABC transport system permease protein